MNKKVTLLFLGMLAFFVALWLLKPEPLAPLEADDRQPSSVDPKNAEAIHATPYVPRVPVPRNDNPKYRALMRQRVPASIVDYKAEIQNSSVEAKLRARLLSGKTTKVGNFNISSRLQAILRGSDTHVPGQELGSFRGYQIFQQSETQNTLEPGAAYLAFDELSEKLCFFTGRLIVEVDDTFDEKSLQHYKLEVSEHGAGNAKLLFISSTASDGDPAKLASRLERVAGIKSSRPEILYNRARAL